MLFNQTSTQRFYENYDTSGLRFGSGVSLVAGGYVKLGNLCVITMRILTTSTLQPAAVIVSGLPRYDDISATKIVSCNNSKGINLEISSSGELTSNVVITGGAIFLSAVYLCNY